MFVLYLSNPISVICTVLQMQSAYSWKFLRFKYVTYTIFSFLSRIFITLTVLSYFCDCTIYY